MSLLLYLDIEKIPIPKEKNLTLRQGGDFIDVYKTFFGNYYGWWIKGILNLSIVGTTATAFTFFLWYLGFTEA